MNKLHNALKTLNLTLEQRNELVKVLGELGGGIPEVWIDQCFVSLGGNGYIYTIDHKPIVDISDPNLYTLMPDWSDPINTYTYDEIQKAIKMLKLDHPCVYYHVKDYTDGKEDEARYLDVCLNVTKWVENNICVIVASSPTINLGEDMAFSISIMPNQDMETYNINFNFL